MTTLRAQHALDHEVSPVRLSLKTRPEAMDAGLTAAFTRSLGYGMAEEIELPPDTTVHGTGTTSADVTTFPGVSC
ncbi:hypothetical protein [Streptomyces mirabilis]|uniref:hypothetical protein n=1 Tax=Streptomyces mirabilis TaxID=68239 RepID=UPI00364FE265